ncbi:MAG: DUF3237 family protein [Eubacterium sp.]|nr:DUF3237 family protein [Eubacterium sp.]
MKELFTLYINCYGSHQVTCQGVTYKQILFDGKVKGPVFQGKILEGGVDTQVIQADGSGRLSARYTLEGEDAQGNACHIYVDNQAELGQDRTEPKCYSDSPLLEDLCQRELEGRMVTDQEGFKIIIYEK